MFRNVKRLSLRDASNILDKLSASKDEKGGAVDPSSTENVSTELIGEKKPLDITSISKEINTTTKIAEGSTVGMSSSSNVNVDPNSTGGVFANNMVAKGDATSDMSSYTAPTNPNTAYKTGVSGGGITSDVMSAVSDALDVILKHKDIREEKKKGTDMVGTVMKAVGTEALKAGDIDKAIEIAAAVNAIEATEEMADIMDKEASMARMYINGERDYIDKKAIYDLTEMLVADLDKRAADSKKADAPEPKEKVKPTENKGVKGEKTVEHRGAEYSYTIVKTPNGYEIVPVPKGMGANRNPQPMRQGKPADGTCRDPLTKTAATLDLVKRILAYGVAPGVVAGGAAAIAPEIEGDGALAGIYNTAVRNPIATGLAVGSIGSAIGAGTLRNNRHVVNPAFDAWVTAGQPGKAPVNMVLDPLIEKTRGAMKGTAGALLLGSLGAAGVREYDRPNSVIKDFTGGTNRTVLPSSNPFALTQRDGMYNPYAYGALGGIGGAGLSMVGQQLVKGSINPMDVAMAGMGGGVLGGGGAYLANQLNVDYNKVKTDRSKPVI